MFGLQESLADSDGGWAAFVGDNTEAASTSQAEEPWDPFQTGRATSAGESLNIEPNTAGISLEPHPRHSCLSRSSHSVRFYVYKEFTAFRQDDPIMSKRKERNDVKDSLIIIQR